MCSSDLPVSVAQALNQAGIESRAGCHCATLAHHALGLTPPASCRLSFYLYNTPDEVDQAVAAVAAIAAGRWNRHRPRAAGQTGAVTRQSTASPPSTGAVMPVMNPLSSPAQKATARRRAV